MKSTVSSGIIVLTVVLLALSFSVGGVSPKPEPPGLNSGGFFSGQIPSLALQPQPEPSLPFVIGLNSVGGLFNGYTISVRLNPQPEPPIPYPIGMDNAGGLPRGLSSMQ